MIPEADSEPVGSLCCVCVWRRGDAHETHPNTIPETDREPGCCVRAGEMLMTLREPDLEELQIPAWSGDRTRLLNAIAQLKANAAAVANGERAPPLAQPQVAAAPVGGPPPDERSMNSPAGQWLVSA
eukprot:3749602-Rhodomonas_salina.2